MTGNFNLEEGGRCKNNYKWLDEKTLTENMRLREVKLVDKLTNMCQEKHAINVYIELHYIKNIANTQ